jgi:hypothetical protein
MYRFKFPCIPTLKNSCVGNNASILKILWSSHVLFLILSQLPMLLMARGRVVTRALHGAIVARNMAILPLTILILCNYCKQQGHIIKDSTVRPSRSNKVYHVVVTGDLQPAMPI